MLKYGYVIKSKTPVSSQKIYNTRRIAEMKIKGYIKDNSLKQRQQTGFIGMRVIRIKLK